MTEPLTQVSWKKTHDTAMSIMEHLNETPVTYGILGSALIIARLHMLDEDLSTDEEIAFVKALMSWVDMYWATSSKEMN